MTMTSLFLNAFCFAAGAAIVSLGLPPPDYHQPPDERGLYVFMRALFFAMGAFLMRVTL